MDFEPSPRKSKTKKNQKKMTKVKDLLRESQENALTMNKSDLDKMFNMQLPDIDQPNDKTSKAYF